MQTGPVVVITIYEKFRLTKKNGELEHELDLVEAELVKARGTLEEVRAELATLKSPHPGSVSVKSAQEAADAQPTPQQQTVAAEQARLLDTMPLPLSFYLYRTTLHLLVLQDFLSSIPD